MIYAAVFYIIGNAVGYEYGNNRKEKTNNYTINQ